MSASALTAVTRIIHEYKLVMPSRLSMLIKCLIILEGTGKCLSPQFNLASLLEPYRRDYIMQQFSPRAWFKKARRMHRDLQVLAEAMPRHANALLEQAETGKFSIRLSHTLLESAVNRLVHGISIGCLLMASARHVEPPGASKLSWHLYLWCAGLHDKSDHGRKIAVVDSSTGSLPASLGALKKRSFQVEMINRQPIMMGM